MIIPIADTTTAPLNPSSACPGVTKGSSVDGTTAVNANAADERAGTSWFYNIILLLSVDSQRAFVSINTSKSVWYTAASSIYPVFWTDAVEYRLTMHCRIRGAPFLFHHPLVPPNPCTVH